MLSHEEYRESDDIDFLISDLSGYRELRQLATTRDGINALTATPLNQVREVLADQYGIRTLLEVEGAVIKFEIVHEGRISFDPPGPDDHICGVPTLTRLDMVTSKLLNERRSLGGPGHIQSRHYRSRHDSALATPPR